MGFAFSYLLPMIFLSCFFRAFICALPLPLALVAHADEEAAISRPLAGGLVEYRPGDTPVILVSGHDGQERPAHIANRVTGIRDNDTRTLPLTRRLYADFLAGTGVAPHMVINHLARAKIDVNRDLAEAQDGDPGATEVWRAYHDAIDEAARRAVAAHGFAFLVDIHRHPHREARLELGLLITRDELNLVDGQLDEPAFAARSSLRLAASRYDGPFSRLLRGEDSLARLYELHGLRAIPGPAEPSPGKERFYSGGYTTQRHAAMDRVDGVQIEVSRTSLSEPDYPDRFTAATLAVLREFLKRHYAYELPGPAEAR